jgi:hypothetical protein
MSQIELLELLKPHDWAKGKEFGKRKCIISEAVRTLTPQIWPCPNFQDPRIFSLK